MARFIPYPFYHDDMPLDLSFVYKDEKPAGRHGFLKVSQEGRFAFEDGAPGRFWGVNFNGGACFPRHAYAETVAKRLAKTGVNLVRFHQLDAEWNTPNIFAFTKGERIGSTLHLHPESMDRLDYLVSCLKKEGLYCYLDMLTYRNFKSGDGVDNPLHLMDAADPYQYYNPRLIQLQKQFIRDIWTHVNPYTGLAYKDDPVFALTEIVNERDFFSRRKLEIEPYVTEFRTLFDQWLKEKGLAYDAFACDVNANDAPLIRFKMEVQEAYYRELYDLMREIGVRIPIAGTNWMTANANTKANLMCDFMDSHTYFYDWSWGETVKKQSHRALTQSFTVAMETLTGVRQLDKPMFVSEWDMPWPNAYRAESPVLYAAIGALQGWDGWAIHTYAYGTRLQNMKILGKESSSSTIGGVPYREGIYSTWNDPAKYGLFYHAALIARRGDVAESRQVHEVFVENLAGGAAKAVRGAAEAGKIGVRFEGQAPHPGAQQHGENDVIVREDAGEVRSDTGELYRSWRRNYGTIDSPRTQCVYGFLARQGEVALHNLSVQADTQFAVVVLSSLTDDPIGSADNLLLTTVGEAINTNARFAGDLMLDYGEPPVLVEVIEAEIAIKTDQPNLKVWGITPEGFYVGALTTEYSDGTLRFRVGDTRPSMYYLIQAE